MTEYMIRKTAMETVLNTLLARSDELIGDCENPVKKDGMVAIAALVAEMADQVAADLLPE